MQTRAEQHTPESVFSFPLLLGKLKIWSLHLAIAIGVRAVYIEETCKSGAYDT